MTPELARELDRLGVVAPKPAQTPAPKRAPVWNPSHPGEQPPF